MMLTTKEMTQLTLASVLVAAMLFITLKLAVSADAAKETPSASLTLPAGENMAHELGVPTNTARLRLVRSDEKFFRSGQR